MFAIRPALPLNFAVHRLTVKRNRKGPFMDSHNQASHIAATASPAETQGRTVIAETAVAKVVGIAAAAWPASTHWARGLTFPGCHPRGGRCN